jgi:predicted ATPase
MIVSKLKLKNWRNFRNIEVNFQERVYIIGPNAAGKSNLLDVFRFLRDVARPDGGGLQKAVKDRGGMTKLRSLMARKDPEVLIELELSNSADEKPLWRYTLAFKSEGKGQQRPVVSREIVEDLQKNKVLLDRPNTDDSKDTDQLTQTYLQQTNTNKTFREIADFFGSVMYLHLVPQLLKHSEQLGSYRMEDDPFGQAFLERIAKCTERTQKSRLKKIGEALQVCVPNMSNLEFERDELGHPHLKAMYKHWRPDAGWQREDQFSDGTLRLLGIMWALLDGDALLLLEEPELSLNEDIVRQIHYLVSKMQKSAKHRRQVFITTHSRALLDNKSIDAREVVLMETTNDGTIISETGGLDHQLLQAGYSPAEVFLPKLKPQCIEQMELL